MPSERVQRRIDRLLDQAEEAADSREWARVQDLCDQVLRLDHDNEDAQAYLEAAKHDTGVSVSGDASSSASPEPAAPSPQPSPEVGEGADQPSSFADGRYEVTKFLGEGSKKKVYLAHDTTLDRDVAFALIKMEGLDDVGRARVAREAQAMGRLGTHPNVVAVLDIGDHDGQPWMVNELLGGGDVEGMIDEADGPLDLQRSIEIAMDICRGLQFAHEQGIIHRDIKPANIWLTSDGSSGSAPARAKVGDFGLAIATDRSRLTQEKMIVGTVSYMPPEQATGGEITPRADLYSLGAMLYEMVTGRPPFMGDDDIAIIGQHINTPAVAPSWHNQSLPQTLNSLIMRLLSKDPGERPGSANEVLQALDAVDLSEVDAARQEEQGSLDAMAGGVFVGRHREMDQLKAMFEEVLSGKGRMVTLVGEPGIGKTRIAQELATYAAMRGGTVLWGRCYESGGAPPYWPWVQALRSHVANTEPADLRSQLGANASIIADLVPDVNEKLPDLPPPAVIGDPEGARFRLFDSLTTFLKNASSDTAIVLMLEDLHWADKPTLMLLEFVARELANSRIFIVGNYRDVELNRRHPLSVTLGDLTRERLFERILLRGLQRHDVERFIEIAANIEPPEALVNTVHAQTEGNPLFVTETVRLLIQEGDITSGARAGGGTSSWQIRIPEGVREVIGRRLDRLSDRCNDVLTIAAVIGRQFRFGALMHLIDDASENMLLDVLDEALEARIVEEVTSEVGLYQFTHAQMQETLTSELSATRIVRLHARIAVALEEFYGKDALENASELAEHFRQAETILGAEKVLAYTRAAGEQAMASYATTQAREYFEEFLELKRDDTEDDETAEVLGLLGRALSFEAAQFEAIAILKRAFRYYVNNGELRRAAEVINLDHSIGVAMGLVAESEESLEYVTAGSLEQGQLFATLGFGYGVAAASNLPKALDYLERGRAIGNKLDDNGLIARVEANTAVVSGFNNDFHTGLAMATRAIELDYSPRLSSIDARSAAWVEICACALGLPVGEYIDTSESRRIAELQGDKYWTTVGEVGPLIRSALMGEWEMLRRVDIDLNLWNQTVMGIMYPVKMIAEYRTGNFGESDAMRERLVEDISNTDDPFISSKRMTLVGADVVRYLNTGTQAHSGFDLENLAQTLDYDIPRTYMEPSLIGRVITSEDPDELGQMYRELLPRAGTISALCCVAVDRVLGGIAIRLGDPGTAIDHFEVGLKFCERAGYRVEKVSILADYSDLLLDRSALGDREKAAGFHDEIISVSRELSMGPMLERVLSQRKILKA